MKKKIKITFDAPNIEVEYKGVDAMERLLGVKTILKTTAERYDTTVKRILELVTELLAADREHDLGKVIEVCHRLTELELARRAKEGNLPEDCKADEEDKEKIADILKQVVEKIESGKATVAKGVVTVGKPDEPQEPLS